MSRRKICVIGAGVIGVSTAARIQDTIPGVDVTIVAEKFSPYTTSDGSGGFWEPHVLADTPIENQLEWSKETFEHINSLIGTAHARDAGVNYVSGYSLHKSYQEDPFWKDIVFGFRHLSERELQLYPGHSHGWFHTSLIANCRTYIPWLMAQFRRKGGSVIKRKVQRIEE
ncbi:unnamed protein product, partial [Owenia fusiformis]